MLFNIQVLSAALLAVALSARHADAQFSRGRTTPGQPPQAVPAGAVRQLPEQLTPDQIKDIFLLRALQSRGRSGRGVRTGVPQFIPFGNPGFFGFPIFPMQNAQWQAMSKSSAQKRVEARAARVERNRIARQKAEEKREQAAQARAKAKAEGKAKDKEKKPARL